MRANPRPAAVEKFWDQTRRRSSGPAIQPRSLCYPLRVPAFDLVTAGEAFEDLIFAGLSRLPRVGEEVRTNSFTRTVGGGAIITAVAAARAGLRCRVVSALGPPAIDLLRREGIVATDLRRQRERPAVT